MSDAVLSAFLERHPWSPELLAGRRPLDVLWTFELSGSCPRDTCEVCAIEFGTGETNSVEVTFRVHSSVREVPPVFYCSAEPATKPHIRLQQRLEPNETRRVPIELEPGDYRVRLRGADESGTLHVRIRGRSAALERRRARSVAERGAEPGCSSARTQARSR